MKTLATAKPNKKYRWYRNLVSIILEARLTDQEQISFYEIDIVNGKERRIAEDMVKFMFKIDHSIKDQPFLKRENTDFFAVLYRNLKENKEQFNRLKQVVKNIPKYIL